MRPQQARLQVDEILYDPPDMSIKVGTQGSPRYANVWQDCESAKHGTIRIMIKT